VARLDLLLARGDGALAPLELLDLAIEVLLFLLETALGLLELAAPVAGFGLDAVAQLERLVVGFEQNFVLARLGLRFDALDVRLGQAVIRGRSTLADQIASTRAGGCCHEDDDDYQDCFQGDSPPAASGPGRLAVGDAHDGAGRGRRLDRVR
jgi:hypothetical protein